jgi:hypothetical protein
MRDLRPLALAGAAASALVVVGCIDGSDSFTFYFDPVNTRHSVTSSALVRIQERWLAYLADELTTGAGGSDFNNDGDVADQVAVLVNMSNSNSVVLQVAAVDLALVSGHLYLVVDEVEDERDWNLDGDAGAPDDLVLLHASASTASFSSLQYVADVRRTGTGPRMLATAGAIFFVEEPPAADPLVAPETGLAIVRSSAPITAVRIDNAEAPAATLRPSLVALDEDLLFATLDETVEARDLNADADSTDTFVLALVDTTTATPLVRNVGLAMAGPAAPVRALDRNSGGWLVAFLVDEAAQGAASLNDRLDFNPSWQPPHCNGGERDMDALDQVLHFLHFDAWVADPIANAPTNTGFAGRDRVLAMAASTGYFVASVVDEADEGNCQVNSLNDDDDVLDRVLRWVRADGTFGSFGFFTDVDGLIALDDTDPSAGGTHGAADLEGRLIAVVDEDADNRNWDGMAAENHVVLWLDPFDGNSATWQFDHGTGAGTQAAGASWMADRPERDRLLVAFQEEVYGAPINGRDSDTNDSVPTFARFDPSNSDDLDFPGPAVAVDEDNAGIVIQNGIAFFRVDESADNADWNNDGDKLDKVLFRTNVSSGSGTNFISVLNNLTAPSVFVGPGDVGAAFAADESMQGKDFNKDGDTNDYALRWMRIGP